MVNPGDDGYGEIQSLKSKQGKIWKYRESGDACPCIQSPGFNHEHKEKQEVLTGFIFFSYYIPLLTKNLR